MDYRKMIFDGKEYNVLTDEELEEIKYQYYLEQEKKRIEKDHKNNTVTSQNFKMEFKERYGL